MQPPKLAIRKGVVMIQGRNRPCIQITAIVDAGVRKTLEEHFLDVNLFKRSAYAHGFPEGSPVPKPTLAPHLGALIKNDACPEITVKTILAGQLFQGQTLWEVKAFEYIGQRAFDSLVDVISTLVEFGREVVYQPEVAITLANAVAFAADTAAEVAAAAAGVAQDAAAGRADAA
ncbi:MAG: hypothetical protein ACK4MF_04450 [Hyphomicrobiaceae bacterium]